MLHRQLWLALSVLAFLVPASVRAQGAPEFFFRIRSADSSSELNPFPTTVVAPSSWNYSSTHLTASGSSSGNTITLEASSSRTHASRTRGAGRHFEYDVYAAMTPGGTLIAHASSSAEASLHSSKEYSRDARFLHPNGTTTLARTEVYGQANIDDSDSTNSTFVHNFGCSTSGAYVHPDYPTQAYQSVELPRVRVETDVNWFQGSISAQGTTTYTLSRGASAPVAAISGLPSSPVAVGSSVNLTRVTVSYDPDNIGGSTNVNGICANQWIITHPDGAVTNGTNANISITATKPGIYQVSLSVTDDEGDQSQTSGSFVVGDRCEIDGMTDELSCGGKASLTVNPCGAGGIGFPDPVHTRGHPLTCNIHLRTQSMDPGRVTPVGNGTFTYGISVRSIGVDGVPHYVLVDANGKEYDFGPTSGSPTAPSGVFSTLTVTGGGFELSGAGEPESIHQAGNFLYEFDSLGKLLSITDPQGNEQLVTYDSNGYPIEVTDLSTNKTIEFEYDTAGLIARIVENGGGAVTHISYSAGKITEIARKDALGNTAVKHEITYDSNGLPATIERDDDPASVVTLTYTNSGLSWNGSPVYLMNYSSALGSSGYNYSEVVPSGYKRRVSKTNAQGGKVYYDFSATTGLLTRITLPTHYGATNNTVYTIGYNSNRQVTSVSNGSVSLSATYASNGLLTQLSDTLGGYTKYTYNGADLTKVEDAVGTQLELEYLDSNQPHVPTVIKDGAGNTWTRTLNAYGQVLQSIPPSGSPLGTMTYTYDENSSSSSFGWLQSIENGESELTSFTYTSLGDIASVTTSPTTGVTNTTSYAYDAAQRVTQITNPDSTTISYSYSGRDLNSIVDEAATTTNFTWCSVCGKLTGLSSPLSRNWSWGLNSDRQTISFTDGRSNQTTYTYGNAGELKLVTYPDSTTFEYWYNNAGQLRRIANPTGINITYDAAGRVKTYDNVTYNYNLDGTVSSITGGGIGTIAYTYTPAKLVESVSYTMNASPLSFSTVQTLEYTYNNDQSLATMLWKNGSTTVASWSYGYDGAGRLVSVGNSFGETTTYAYDDEGKLVTQTNDNGTTVTFDYNQARGWPTSINHSNGGGTFLNFDLEYDGGSNTVGNLTEVTENSGAVVTYTYDDLYRLTSETKTGTGAYAKSYGYDLAGNITSLDGSSWATYDSANKISTIPGGTAAHTASGALSSISGTGLTAQTYTHNVHGKITRINQGSPYSDYRSMLTGPLLYSVASSTGVKKYYIYSGSMLVGEVHGTTPSVAYTWGADGVVSKRDLTGTPKSFWYHFGPQGETRALTDSGASVTDTYAYTAYGLPLSSAGSTLNPLRYGGRYGYFTDVSNGIIFAGARQYSPEIMRWTSRDPIGYRGGTNLYEYVHGNPVGWVDLRGTHPIAIIAIGVGVIYDLLTNPTELEKPYSDVGICIETALSSANPLRKLRSIGPILQMAKGRAPKLKGRRALREHNQVVRSVAKELGLSQDQAQQLHREVSGFDLDIHEIYEYAKAIFNKNCSDC